MSKDDAAVHAVDAEIFGIMLKHRQQSNSFCCSCGKYISEESAEGERREWLKHLASMIAERLKELG